MNRILPLVVVAAVGCSTAAPQAHTVKHAPVQRAAGRDAKRHEVHRAPAVQQKPGPAGVPLLTPWVERGERSRLENLGIALTDHDGRERTLDQLIDKPVLLTFFYSRCQNASRCSTTVAQLAALQQRLAGVGLRDRVRLLAVTFEPHYDLPQRLTSYAQSRGFELGADALAVRLDAAAHPKLVAELEVPVSYNAGWVNTHGVEAVLLDPAGRIARRYVTLVWDNDQVLRDFQRLLAER